MAANYREAVEQSLRHKLAQHSSRAFLKKWGATIEAMLDEDLCLGVSHNKKTTPVIL